MMSMAIDFLAGAGKGAVDVAENYIQMDMKAEIMRMQEEKDRRVAEFSSQLRRSDFDWEQKRKQEILDERIGRTEKRAQGIADQRGQGLIDNAMAASNLIPEDGGSKFGADGRAKLQEAIQSAASEGSYKQTPTSKDYATAGLIESNDMGGVYKMEKDEEKTTYDRSKDARDFALREKETEARIAQMAQAAADRATAKADKEALKQEYELLGHYLSSKATNPTGDYTKQIAASVSKISSLGGNPQTMIDLMLGKETSQTVATKVGDAKVGEPETTTTKVVKGPRQGGVLPSPIPPEGKVIDFSKLPRGGK